jgi:DoxX-like protein
MDMRFNRGLWVAQGLLALLFLFAGVSKLVLPIEAMAGPVSLPGWFLRFIGIAETLGAVGLILPWLFKIRPELTPLAASGLVIIMLGATAVTLIGGMGPAAVVPFAIGALAAWVAYGRARLAALRAV